MHLLQKKKKSIPLNKQKEIFYNLVAERIEEIKKLRNSINFQNLIDHCKSPTKDVNFNDFIDAEALFDDIENKI